MKYKCDRADCPLKENRMNDDFCEKHGTPLRCLAGHSAHPLNWYCPDCDKEEEADPTTEEWRDDDDMTAQRLSDLREFNTDGTVLDLLDHIAELEAGRNLEWNKGYNQGRDDAHEHIEKLKARVAELTAAASNYWNLARQL